MNPDDGGVLQRSDQAGFSDELVNRIGKGMSYFFVQRNQKVSLWISATKPLVIMFLEDDLSVQRSVMGQIYDTVRPWPRTRSMA